MAKILIIEDDDVLGRFYKKVLSAKGHSVEIAADGGEGLAKIKSQKPALILLDIMMPNVNGLEVLKAVKTDPQTEDIPVIVLTNLAGEADAQFALQKGADKYLVKSRVDAEKVIAEVSQSLASVKKSVK